MSDDIARQRFWSENSRKPDPARRRPRMPRSTSTARGLRAAAVEPTHVLMVRPAGTRAWSVVAERVRDRIRDVQGTEAFCQAECARRSRHWPESQFRVLPWPEAKRELRRKTWSVKDADHIPSGERVLLAKAPAQLHPGLVEARTVFGLPDDGADRRRVGVVRSRNRRTGDYMVKIEGSGLSVSVTRIDLIWPVPENVVPLERRSPR